MKAITQDRYGSADVLEFTDIEEPVMARTTSSFACTRPAAVPMCGT